MDLTDCSIHPSGEVYGLGARLGLYLNCLTLLLLSLSNCGSWALRSTVQASNALISCTMLTQFVINAVQSKLVAPDFLIMFYLIVMLFFRDSYNARRKFNMTKGGFIYVLEPDDVLLLQNTVCLAASTIGVWFWIAGLDQVSPTACTTKAAVVGVFDMNQTRWRRFAITFSIFSALVYCFLLYIHGKNHRWWTTSWLLRRPVSSEPQIKFSQKCSLYIFPLPTSDDLRAVFAIDASVVLYVIRDLFDTKMSTLRVLGAILLLFWWIILNIAAPIIAVVSVERMILVNSIRTSPISESAGQILILLIGTFNLLSASREIVSILWVNYCGSQPPPVQSLLDIYAYHFPTPVDKRDLREILQETIWAHHRFGPDISLRFEMDSQASLLSTLRMALVCELGDEMDTNAKNGGKSSLEQFRTLRVLEDLFPELPEFRSCRGAALFTATNQGRLDVLKLLLGVDDDNAEGTVDNEDDKMRPSTSSMVYPPEARRALVSQAGFVARRQRWNEELDDFLHEYRRSTAG
ncbi:hypothetical protein P170DRAFT_508956 [Aspergillus steynii IBT 23096]|uniref:Uncharacterized protein n=1 Tax=Aspergillus steynii IBT 23096 TaxID=1392250 RepID=A0A2I2GDC5_9EURO|nr:uncharacterized protein P170DRAFT_508956 [Aspergillus steynii IBT 23096]PLB50860.1 hypothetical protein P170DRAFT_508956 [Aspergillus steynii IBT 23096]